MYSSSLFLLLGPRNEASVYKFNRGTATLQYTEEPLKKEEVKNCSSTHRKKETTTGRTKEEEASGRNEKLQVLVRSSSILILIKDNAEYKGKLVAQEQNIKN